MADRLMHANLTFVPAISGKCVFSTATLIAFMWVLASSGLAVADELVDPTRPPEGILLHEGNGTGTATTAVAESEEGFALAAPVTKGLQMVFISKARKAAVIDGKTIELGAKYGDARLLEVSESGVVLQGLNGRREVMLFPKVKMTKTEMKITMPVEENTAQTGKIEHKPVEQEERK